MEIHLIETQRALSPTRITLADYVINPYKGCLIGCQYCYARTNSQIQKIRKLWGKYLYIKKNFLQQLKLDLEQTGSLRRVLIGSTTEPFQPAVQTRELICEILSLLKVKGIPVIILSKSPDIADFTDLLTYSPYNEVYLTCNSPLISKLFEQHSAPQEERIRAAGCLMQAGINTTVYISPVFPFLTQIPALLEALKGKTNKIGFENFNPKLGNWQELKTSIPGERVAEIEAIYSSAGEYHKYWKCFETQLKAWNQQYGYQLNFFIYPFNAYYNTL